MQGNERLNDDLAEVITKTFNLVRLVGHDFFQKL